MSTPSVLFVCVKNAGKSQLAAALARQLAAGQVDVHSAGTHPGQTLNEEVVTVLREVDASTDGEHPKPVDPDLLGRVDRIVLLGHEADLEVTTGTPVERWDTDEPSLRGITGLARMRLIREDISHRVEHLIDQLSVPRPEPMQPEHWPAVREIYAAGIATGHATFEVEPPLLGGLRSHPVARPALRRDPA